MSDIDNDDINESPFEEPGSKAGFGSGARRHRAGGAAEESSAESDLGSSWEPDTRSGQPSNKPVASEPERGRAIASLVFGIISIVFGSAYNLWLSVVGLVLAISGTVLAVQAKRGGNTSGVRLWGLIISICGIVYSAGFIIFCFFSLAMFGAILSAL